MSGIAGILNLDDAPVDRALLSSLSESMHFRGPDATRMWIDGAVGFGHTQLRTTWEAEQERQPFSLDGKVWIVADARIDARKELARSLADDRPFDVPDAELILRAYLRWGEACVDHLLGDFAFAVWDARKRRLFCARDHFGIKPFYYALARNSVVFGNTLHTLRLHPEVSSTLNELAIADFLLCGLNQEVSTTSFRDIRRLPPAHFGIWDSQGWQTQRYWTLPVEEPIYFRRSEEYAERLLGLLDEAVKDRLRTDRVGVYMSGGLDSPLLAATARKFTPEGGTHAYTVVYDKLIPNQERYYSGLVASSLKIPIHYTVADSYLPFERWQEFAPLQPDPTENLIGAALSTDQTRELGSHARVAFYGEGPDNALHYDWRPYLKTLLERRQWGHISKAVISSLVQQRRLPLSRGLLGLFQPKAGAWTLKAGCPRWLNADFARRLDLERRWQAIYKEQPKLVHPVHPIAYNSLLTPLWQRLFESCDAGMTGIPVEVRHPYMDLRVLRYLLRVPPVPYCRRKHLIREALRGFVPDSVRLRSKAPLAGDPSFEALRSSGMPKAGDCAPSGEFIDWAAVPDGPPSNGDEMWTNLRPIGFSYWLTSNRTIHHGQEKLAYATTQG